jgi:glucose-6-phosphate 1-dehydrogenase
MAPSFKHHDPNFSARLRRLTLGYQKDMPVDQSARRRMRGDALVMFGLTGDLGEKKLFPALYELQAAGRLDVPVIGVGRSTYSDDELRKMLVSSLDAYEPSDGRTLDPDIVEAIDLTYLTGDSAEVATYEALAERFANAHSPVVYAALPPGLFDTVADRIAASHLPETTRLVVEKPFGEDAASARRLYRTITQSIGSDRLFIVDHFLAKSSIENMLTVRSTNALIANSMCAAFVESIVIMMAETTGVDGSGSFYESVGAVKDVLQNHLMETLALVTMEPPENDGDDAFGRSRVDLLSAVDAADPARAVFGQYAGYRDLDDVDDDSDVETFVSCELHIDNDRWRGVPVQVTTGKRLADLGTSVTVTLKDPDNPGVPTRNRIRFVVKPDASVILELGALDAESHQPTAVEAVVCGPSDHGPLGDYATMLDHALAGTTRHFAHIDGIIEAWRIVQPLVEGDLDVEIYRPGSAGPPRRERETAADDGRSRTPRPDPDGKSIGQGFDDAKTSSPP